MVVMPPSKYQAFTSFKIVTVINERISGPSLDSV